MSVTYKGKKFSIEDGILDLSSKEISKISEIEGLDKLQNLFQLDLSNNQIKSMECLETLLNLRILKLNNNYIQKIEGLSVLKNLTTLYLNGNQIRKIEGVSDLSSLTGLYLANNQIKDIEEIDTLINLEELNLSNNNIDIVKELKSVRKLTSLFLGNNKIFSIEGMQNLNELICLYLNNNQIRNIEGLDTLVELKELYLDSNQIIKIQGLHSLVNLTDLHLENNKIEKIEELDTLIKLSRLFLNENSIIRLENLGSLLALSAFRISNNKIDKIDGLESLTNLKELYLNGNKIKRIEGLTKQNNLVLLDLSRNCIKKIEGLSSLIHLKELYLLPSNCLEYEAREVAAKPLPEILKFSDISRYRKDEPSEDEYQRDYNDLLCEFTNQEEVLTAIGTWRQGTDPAFLRLKEKQNSWFLHHTPQGENLCSNSIDPVKGDISIYLVQLHELPRFLLFQSNENQLTHFQKFIHTFWNDKYDSVLVYQENQAKNTGGKIIEIIDIILDEDNANKLIVFPENTIPYNYISPIREKISNFLQKKPNQRVVLVGGMEHREESQESYVNEAIIINGVNGSTLIDLKWNTQLKNTPVTISQSPKKDIIEGIQCKEFPEITIFSTYLGRIAIFICRDFLRLSEVIPFWAERYSIDWIIVPSLSSKVLPFHYRLQQIFSEWPQDALKIIWANVGEFGGSEFYCKSSLSRIEYNFQKGNRDNIGEVIVRRIVNFVG